MTDELGHTPKACEREGCENEAVRFYEEANGADTVYVCLEHPDIEQAEDEDGTILNNNGDRVELAVYQCDTNCRVCD